MKPVNTISQKRSSDPNWTKRLIVSLTILTWLALTGLAFWFLGLIAYPIILMVVSLLIAYILYPLAKLLKRGVPNVLAVLIAYLAVLVGLLLILYYVFWTAIAQFVNLLLSTQQNLPSIIERFQPVITLLQQVGISPQQFAVSGTQLLNQVSNVTSKLLPLAGNIFVLMISVIIIISLSIYFTLDGQRIIAWLKNKSPLDQRPHLSFFLDTLDQVIGAFLRGQILLAVLTTIIMGIGLTLIGVPYAILLTVIVFIFEFVPQIGSYISSAIIIAFAFLTRGWEIGLIVVLFSGLIQGVLEGQILIPRILGGAVGLHPIVSLFALLIGATLFGLPGAIFAAPVAGILQVFCIAAWQTWKQAHPEQFPEETVAPSAAEDHPAIEGI